MQDNSLNNKTVLVTGASGFIGSKLLDYLANSNVRVIALVRKKADLINEKEGIEYEYGNISHNNVWKKVILKYNFDYIFHLAALEYQGLNGNILRDLNVNVKSTVLLLDNIKLLSNKPRVIFFSSINIFGSTTLDSVTEGSSPKPESYWSHHKILSQYYFELYNKIYNVESIILMLPNIFGFSKNLEVTLRMSVNKMISGAILDNKVALYKNSNIKRNFLYIDDLINAILMSLSIKKWDASKYLIGDDIHYSFDNIFTILKNIENKIVKEKNTIQLDKFEMRNYKISVEKFKSETKWEVKSSFQENIVNTYEDILLNYGNQNLDF
jgi:UDP-glucose 4-epimerase